MLNTTLQAVRSILAADPSINPLERNRLVALLRQGPAEPKAAPVVDQHRGPRLMRRREVADRLSVSLRTVDKLATSGTLRKRTFPGRQRASGFLEADLVALLTGEVAQ